MIPHRTPSWPAGGRRVASLALLGVAAGLVVLAALTVHPGSVGAALAGAHPDALALSVIAYAAGQTLSGVMWAICQRAGGVRIGLGTTLGLHWISRGACELLPASLGEVVRVGLVRRHPNGASAGAWRIAGGLAGYKGIDAAVTALAVLAITMAAPLPGPAGNLRWTALGAIVVVAVLALAWRRGAGRRLVRRLPRGPRRAARRMREGAGVLGDARAARSAALVGAGAVAARLVSLAALLAAFGVPATAAGLVFSVVVLAGAVPAMPGGGGARELLLVPALALAYGTPASTALALSLAVQATALVASLGAALLALAWLGRSIGSWGAERPAPAPASA
ncbi:lysylphosphatidylglycerol synthase domain-containing protein [Miltoncostaea marina]|uniref:lysylphosphatidylglycerol synthase domain-containing protein n=1 Tax=Miltoncostaea marina TaxID=2843215 RepID=UPI001C3DEF43|nr:lysylphosphatidylglycerol synthase domain-containing protein [Miltoncostaea marina]